MTELKLRHKKVAVREADDIKFIPYTRHVDDTLIALEDGSLMRMYRVDGRPFETSDVADLNTWHSKLNIAWRAIGDDRVALWTHLVRSALFPGTYDRSLRLQRIPALGPVVPDGFPVEEPQVLGRRKLLARPTCQGREAEALRQ